MIDPFDWEQMRVYLGSQHACVVAADDEQPGGWRPCPWNLCERIDHMHDICPECGNDLATFMHEKNCSRA